MIVLFLIIFLLGSVLTALEKTCWKVSHTCITWFCNYVNSFYWPNIENVIKIIIHVYARVLYNNYIITQARSSMVFIGPAGKKKVRRANPKNFCRGHAHFFIMTPRQYQHHSAANWTADTSQNERSLLPFTAKFPLWKTEGADELTWPRVEYL